MQNQVNGLTRWLAGFSVVVAAALSLSGCNTVEGFGKDLEAAGQAISESVE